MFGNVNIRLLIYCRCADTYPLYQLILHIAGFNLSHFMYTIFFENNYILNDQPNLKDFLKVLQKKNYKALYVDSTKTSKIATRSVLHF